MFYGIKIVKSLMLVGLSILNFHLAEEKQESSEPEDTVKNANRNYMDITQTVIDGLYAEKHEFGNHLQMITGFINTNEADMAVEYIDDYIKEIAEKNRIGSGKRALLFRGGDCIVNALLYSKQKEAERENISFSYELEGYFPEFPCEKYELVEIISNLMNNAFDYVKTLEKKDRKVLLKIEEDEDGKRIEVWNTYLNKHDCDLKKMTKLGYSTKKGGRRGYGLHNVVSIVERYRGALRICKEKNEIVMKVTFDPKC